MIFEKKIPEITCQELNAAILQQDEFFLLDVRNPSEMQYGKIRENQILISLPELEQRVNELEDFKNIEIIVYCRSGGRSARATEFLQERGFTKARNLVGGILAWKKFDPKIIPY